MSDVKIAIEVLRAGGVIAHATDTCYGFACDISNEAALKRLFALKKMSRSKPVSILVADFAMAEKYGHFNSAAKKLAWRYWPGPLTIIVEKKNTLPVFFNAGTKTVGIRVPGDSLSRSIVRAFGKPIATTSANISGKPPPYSISALKKQFAFSHLKPHLILNSGRLDKKNLPSTVIDLSASNPKIIRQGTLSNLVYGV